VTEKILRWLVFGAVVSVLPLGYAYGDLLLRLQEASLAKVISNGELLVVVWVLCASALGELFGSGDKYPIPKIIAGGLVLILIIASALFFSSITEARAANISIDEHFVVVGSAWLFFSSLIACLICLACSEG